MRRKDTEHSEYYSWVLFYETEITSDKVDNLKESKVTHSKYVIDYHFQDFMA